MTWLSKAAVLWVMDEAPDVPPHLLSTLIAVARFADENGRGAYISASTVAQLTRKTESQAKRDLGALEKKKLLKRGNQRLVAHIRADRRPVVYNIPMPERGSTDATSSRGSTHATPQPNGVAYRPERGSTQGANGVAHTLPKEVFNTSGERARDASGDDAPHAPEDQNPAAAALSAEPTHCTDSHCRGSRFPVDPATGMHDECKGFARFRSVRIL